MQGWRGLSASVVQKRKYEETSFQLIVPFLKEFEERNTGTTINYEVEDNDTFVRFFVCPGGMMNYVLNMQGPLFQLMLHT